MTWLDYLLLATLAVSVLLGIWRGFVKEILSILIWIVAFGVAIWFAPDMAQYCKTVSDNPAMQATAAFLILFFLALVGGMLLHLLLMTIVDQTEFSIANRILGGLFGLVRGIALALVIVMLLSFTTLSKSPNWQHARVLPSFLSAADWIQAFLIKNAPQNIVKVLEQVKTIKGSDNPPDHPSQQQQQAEQEQGSLKIRVINVNQNEDGAVSVSS